MTNAPSPVRRLTGKRRRPISLRMRRTRPLSWLLRALSLAAMGVLFAAGSAAAHDGHAAGLAQAPPSASAAASSEGKAGLVDTRGVATTASMEQAAVATNDGDPCSETSGSGKHATGCCTMACHAALAALPAGPLLVPEKPLLDLVGISDRLDGCAGGRTERPPKLV